MKNKPSYRILCRGFSYKATTEVDALVLARNLSMDHAGVVAVYNPDGVVIAAYVDGLAKW